MASNEDIAHRLLTAYGRTYADEAGIKLRDTPAPLYQLLVLATLLSARISADIAVAAARELFAAGYRTPRAMRDATWQDRVDALGRGHYRRYDERTATMLGNAAELVLDRWRGDLRNVRKEAGNADELTTLLCEAPGIGPTGAAIFCREVQDVWTELRPYVDAKAARGAERLGLPTDPDRLAGLAGGANLAPLVAACVRAALSKRVAEEVGA